MNYGEYQSTQVAKAAGSKTKIQTDEFGNLKTVGAGSGATATQVHGNVAAGAVDSGNPVKVGAKVLTTAPVGNLTNGHRADLSVDAYNALRTMPAEALTAADGNPNSAMAGIRMTGNWGPLLNAPLIYNGTTWDRAKKPSLVSRLLSAAASTNSTNVKASAGDVFRIAGYNNNAAARFLKLYNKSTAPVVGTDTPVATYRLAPTAHFDIELHSLYFSLGIGYGLTTAAADADIGALTAGDIVAMNVIYA